MALLAEQEPSCAPLLAPSGAHPIDHLLCPTNIDPILFQPFAHLRSKSVSAVNDFKYWTGAGRPLDRAALEPSPYHYHHCHPRRTYSPGADPPYRCGTDDAPVTNESVVASEQVRRPSLVPLR